MAHHKRTTHRLIVPPLMLFFLFGSPNFAAGGPAPGEFIRGDVNGDGLINFSDLTRFLDFFMGGEPLPCEDAADVVNDEQLVLVSGAGRAGPLSDFDYLFEWFLSAGPDTIDLPAPYPEPGVEISGPNDSLDCGDGSSSSPGEPQDGYSMAWQGPEFTLDGNEPLDVVLQVDTLDEIIGFSIVTLFNVGAASIIDIGFEGIITDAATRTQFEDSNFFRWSLKEIGGQQGGDGSEFALLIVGAAFVEGPNPLQPIDFKPTQEPVNDFPLLRVTLDVNDGVFGVTELFKPFEGEFDIGHLVGGPINQFAARSSGVPLDLPLQGFDPFLNAGEIGILSFVRGDSNGDLTVDVADPVFTLFHLLKGGPTPRFRDSADVDDSGQVDLADPVYTMRFLFLESAAPLAPFPACGTDPTFLDGMVDWSDQAACLLASQ